MAPMPVVSADKCARSDAAFFAEYVSENAFCAGYKNGTIYNFSQMKARPIGVLKKIDYRNWSMQGRQRRWIGDQT